MDPVWLLLLLPAAAASGWFAASRGHWFASGNTQYDLPDAYLKGLNFVLNEQPDKAIEVFVKALEVDTETVEMHLALGNLFRKRGEIERATRIHQNLVSKTNLDKKQRTQALYELGQDYFKAGLYDRAESLLLESVQSGAQRSRALQYLLQIYDQEKEWDSAISIAQKIQRHSERDMTPVIAQYFCELAETAVREGHYNRSAEFIEKALRSDSRCLRAIIQQGRLRAIDGDHEGAIIVWCRVEDIDPDYLGEVVELIANSYKALGKLLEYQDFLQQRVDTCKNAKVMNALMEVVYGDKDDAAVEKIILNRVRSQPSVQGLYKLIQVRRKRSDSAMDADLGLLEKIIGSLIKKDSDYECRQCGFAARSLHWQCPGCKHWNTIRPCKNLSLSDDHWEDAIEETV
ncbi:MAG: lipopolysaccharide assembly protein LapB [Arenicellales bacterium WSBS_2016_MAG_OTU3]